MKNWTDFYKKPLASLNKLAGDFLRTLLLFLVATYRTAGSLFLGGQCRFQPSCSQYAVDALHTKPVGEACQLIIKRILRCHPFGSSGWDPVPARKEDLNARQQSTAQTL
jgi:putative membrane protein insertion efficiency factor